MNSLCLCCRSRGLSTSSTTSLLRCAPPLSRHRIHPSNTSRRFPGPLQYNVNDIAAEFIFRTRSNMAINEYCNRPYTVFVEGNVGSGKTTFLEQFADCPNVYLVKEPVHKWQDVQGHNFLFSFFQGLMYKDPKRWSFAFQSIVQRTMLELHQARPERPGQNIKIMERSIYSARNIFVENLYKDNLMAAPEYSVLDAWYKWLIGNVEIESDLIIYLRTDPEVAYQRIKTRNRFEEKDVSFEYIEHLHNLHDKWLNVHNTDVPKNIPVMIVDANQSMDSVRKQFKGIRDLITKNASALIESKTSPTISEIGKNIKDIQHISSNCKLIPDSTIVPAQRV
ncbi:deoxynucleoside kinase-like isoform X1 [Rhopalosiphum padi]|uniref:deoxynucleoside kinase-like isoform X1 n=1 Tax=Rhopalosiphum padi TaxID=40932 RepID=UPI00298D7C79|nr:deoxynucleoside kinase-like isoform X1 [Rhopalosiphum padi]